MKAHLIDTYLLIPRSRSSAKVKVKYQGHVSLKMGVSGGISISQTHLVLLFANALNLDQLKIMLFDKGLTLSQITNFGLFQTKRVLQARISNFLKMAESFPNGVENTEGKGEIAHHEQFFLFSQLFQETFSADKLKPGLVWERIMSKFRHWSPCTDWTG